MRKKMIAALLTAFMLTVTAAADNVSTAKGDPMKARIYTLDNGLKVYLSVNKEKPRIQTYIAVRTGSRNDPKETTGLAHYLEHLMFKGTTHFGTTNAAAEKPLLDSIEARFEKYRYIVNNEQRRRWYHQIDSLSQLAAVYNIPNEYDKMMTSIGSEGSNAYTSNDQTCYVEDIPANEIDTWARIQADRFQNMVIRGFHTELEAVYEEYNIDLASDFRKEYAALCKGLFPTHPYGTQTTIGTQEHLKNPSITNIKNYFRKYYVPNNVAIVMAGDLNPDSTIAIIKKYFGAWKPAKTIDRPEYAPLKPLTAHKDTSVIGQEAENVMIGWRFAGASSLESDTLDLVCNILSNGKAGLFDTNINQPMKMQGAEAFTDDLHDYSSLVLYGQPKPGQSLDEVRDIMLGEVKKLRDGNFDNALVPAIVANKKKDYLESLSNNRSRVEQMKDAFINDEKWQQVVDATNRQAGITKQQIISFAKRYLNDGYVCVFKKQGNDTTIHKIDKPAITPIPTNNDKQSAFLKGIVSLKPQPIQPRFVDFSADMQKGRAGRADSIIWCQNADNDLFRLEIDFPVGSESDNTLSVAADLLEFAHTQKHSANDFKKAFYDIACDYSVSVGARHTRIKLSGLNENMPKALSLFADMLNNGEVTNEEYSQVAALILKARNDAKSNQRACFQALRNYAIYGEFNPTRNIIPETKLKSADGNALLARLRSLRTHTPAMIMYYGPSAMADIAKTVEKLLPGGKAVERQQDDARHYTAQTTTHNEVLIAPYDAKNIYMMQYHNEQTPWKPEHAPINALFNEYFGGGMNAIVFQELREARGLAYSASAYYSEPAYRDEKESFYTFIISQNDKMMDCVDEFNKLMNNMPRRDAGFTLARQSILKTIASERTTKFSILNAYMSARDRGLDYDIHKLIYDNVNNITLGDLEKFAKTHISGKTFKYIILGDEKNLDMERLHKIAPITRLTLQQIFGY